MGIMFFRHARIGMAQLFGDNGHGDAFHRQQAAVRVAQNMEADRGFDFYARARFLQRSMLVRFSPSRAVIVRKNQSIAFFVDDGRLKERLF